VVVNDEDIVLGLLQGDAWHSAPEAVVELAMESGPTTIRPNRSLGDIREYMRQHGAACAPLTPLLLDWPLQSSQQDQGLQGL
jgi:hypothetical protein